MLTSGGWPIEGARAPPSLNHTQNNNYIKVILIPDTNLTLYNLQCPFERRTLAEKLKVKELGPDQPDGLIYCEELFVKLFAVPVCHSPTSKKFTSRHWC